MTKRQRQKVFKKIFNPQAIKYLTAANGQAKKEKKYLHIRRGLNKQDVKGGKKKSPYAEVGGGSKIKNGRLNPE